MNDILLTDGEIKSEVVAALGHYPDDEMRALRGLCCAQVRKVWKVIFPELDHAMNMLHDVWRGCAGELRFGCVEGESVISHIWWALREIVNGDGGSSANQNDERGQIHSVASRERRD